MCGRNRGKTLTLRSQHHFLITFTLDAPNENANQTRKLLDNTTRCLNPVFLLEQLRNYQDGTNLAQNLQRSPTTWKDMLENAWNGISNWHTKDGATILSFSSLFGRSPNQRKWKITVNCQKFAPILYQNACAWHELVDLTFCGQSTNWHDLSQNGLKHATDDWNDEFSTFIS